MNLLRGGVITARDGNMGTHDINMRDITPDSARVNEYFAAAAQNFKVLKYLTLLLLFAFLTVMAAVYHSALTYDNFKYMLKDLDTNRSASDSSHWEDVHYDALSNPDFSLFRSDLVTVGVSRISLYNASGNRLYTDTRTMKTPVLCTSEKYFLVYDLGLYTYTLYNSFTSVLTEETDYKLYGGDVCDEGSFALLTGSRESKYKVTVYNSSFNAVMSITKNKYVTDIALRGDGKEIAVVSAGVTDSSVSTEIVTVAVGNDTAKSTYTIAGTIPIRVNYFNDGSLCVVCDDGLHFYDADGISGKTYNAGVSVISRISFAGDAVAVSFNENTIGNTNNILLFDTEGNILYNITENMRIEDICLAGNSDAYTLCLLGPSDAVRIILSNNAGTDGYLSSRTVQKHSGGVTRILIDDKGNVLLCASSSSVEVFTGE